MTTLIEDVFNRSLPSDPHGMKGSRHLEKVLVDVMRCWDVFLNARTVERQCGEVDAVVFEKFKEMCPQLIRNSTVLYREGGWCLGVRSIPFNIVLYK